MADDMQTLPALGLDLHNESAQEVAIKFSDGQPVQLEDGSTAYILTTYKEGTQPIILEDGTTAYISHDPPSSLFDHGMEGSSLGLDSLPPVGDAEEKQTPSVDQKMFKCEYEGCGKIYATLHHLQYHRRSHLEKKPFVCGFAGCEKTFATSYGLKSHVRVHTGEKPYKCPEAQCTKAFKTSGDLQKHIRTHTGEKPFKCPFEGCNRSFTTSNIRKVHIRTHTGERPYSCEQCGRTFASATNHKNHMRIHTGEKPYACTYEGCNKRFTEYSSLYKHHVVHTQTKPYVCPSCGKHYRQTSTLAMHRRTAHGETDVVLSTATDSDVINGQLIALDQNKELVGIITSGGNKQLGSATVVTTNQLLASATSDRHKMSSKLSLSDIDTQNVVIVTDPSCFRVIQSQVSDSTVAANIPTDGAGSHSISVSTCVSSSSAAECSQDSMVIISGDAIDSGLQPAADR